jgi:hypothetical protein
MMMPTMTVVPATVPVVLVLPSLMCSMFIVAILAVPGVRRRAAVAGPTGCLAAIRCALRPGTCGHARRGAGKYQSMQSL